MNLYKIYKSLDKYVNTIKDIEVPDVYECYKKLGKEVMGRDIYTFEQVHLDEKDYFNKYMVHKEKESFIGKPKVGYYAQDILEPLSFREVRCLCINGEVDSDRAVANYIMCTFGIKDFVFDVFYMNNKRYLMEVNEIHLSTLNKRQLDFILKNVI